MKKNRTIIILLILILTMGVLSGCSQGRHKIENGKIFSEEGLLQGDYGLFDGQYLKKVDFQEGSRVTFGYAVGTLSGELSAYFLNPTDDTRYLIEDDATYEIKESGTYKIEIVGNSHSGAFALEWKID